jgi:glycosyltransferase involved in cell wall biosynthesis
MLEQINNKVVPKVSIGMPVYNGEKYIREAIDSLLVQTFSDFELIISDNASTDNTETICREFAIKNPRIRYVRQNRNIGALNNFRFVVDNAYGEYFSWLAHDDLLEKDFISICSKFLDENSNCVLVSGDFLAIDEDNAQLTVERLLEVRYTIKWQKRIFEFYRYPISNAFFCIYGLMRKKNAIEVMGNLRVGPLLSASELPILSRFSALGEVSSLPIILRKYRYHFNSTFHIEQKKLLGMPIRRRLLLIYNNFWHVSDQIIVLFGAGYTFTTKLKVLYKIIAFNARRLIRVFFNNSPPLK